MHGYNNKEGSAGKEINNLNKEKKWNSSAAIHRHSIMRTARKLMVNTKRKRNG